MNFLALSISFYKKWTISAYIGLWLNIMGSFYIFLQVQQVSDPLGQGAMVVYGILAFLSYTLIPIVGNYKAQLAFKIGDCVLIGLNTALIGGIIQGLWLSSLP